MYCRMFFRKSDRGRAERAISQSRCSDFPGKSCGLIAGVILMAFLPAASSSAAILLRPIAHSLSVQPHQQSKKPTASEDLPPYPSGIVEFPSAFFTSGSSNLMPMAVSALRRYVKMLLSLEPDASLKLVGHADCVGGTYSNLNLSVARANSVANWLRQNGLAANTITVIGVGDSNSITANCTNGANRRVDIFITS